MSPTSIGLLIFVLYLLGMVAIGLISARYQKTSEDFWVAGRRFGLPVMIMATMAAIMHGGSVLSGVAFAGVYGGVALFPTWLLRPVSRSSSSCLPRNCGNRVDSRFRTTWAIASTAGFFVAGAPSS